MDKVYIVMGHSGEYDDYRNWITKAFWHRSDAMEYARNCQDEADRILKEIEVYETRNAFEAKKNPIDYLKKLNMIWKTHKYDELFEEHCEIPIEYTIEEVEIQ